MPDDFASSWVERYVVGRREGIREGFVVVEDDDVPVGFAFAPRIDRETATAELGYVVAPEARGRGVAGLDAPRPEPLGVRRISGWSGASS